MKRVPKWILIGAAMALPAGYAVAKRPPASSLNAYIGKYPWQKVNGVAFVDDPRIKAAVRNAAPLPEIREAVLGEDMINPIVRVGDRLLASGWDKRSAGSTNWAILAALDGSRMAVCYYQEYPDNKSSWYIDGKLVDSAAYTRNSTARGCPSEAGDVAALGTFPVGPMPQ